MNVPLKESANQAQGEDGVYDFSMSLVPFEPNKQDVVNEFKDDSYFPAPKETNTMQEITVDINCQNHREILDDFEHFSSDGYQNMGEFEREVEVEEERDEEDEQGHADDSEEHTEEDDDSEYIVDPEAILDDWDVDMREFNSCVDERAVGGSSQGGVGRSSKDVVGGTSQGSVGGSSEDVMGGLRAKKMDKGKKSSSRT
ncbi:unnamed protein product [Lactuca virosa]|uniref:Uncharacterized protein n=1 Tax=Lactuca virosa TaxID=75947 RepID=A0AAU9NH25_9ASTR|nr:unnamed protein product [Lactuca virosa]